MGTGFLLAVLWFDLMFDVQVRGQTAGELPADVRNSIAAYYRRVTTDAHPMSRLVAAAMLMTIAALAGAAARHDVRAWAAWPALGLVVAAVGLAAARTVRNAVRLGSQAGTATEQSVLARTILRDHAACLAAVALALVLEIAGAR